MGRGSDLCSINSVHLNFFRRTREHSVRIYFLNDLMDGEEDICVEFAGVKKSRA